MEAYRPMKVKDPVDPEWEYRIQDVKRVNAKQVSYIQNHAWELEEKIRENGIFGADLPVYELRGNDLRIRFKALQRALIDQPKVSESQHDTLGDTLENKIVALLKENPSMTQTVLAEKTKVSVPSIKRAMKILSDTGRIVRIGGKRFGYWEIK